MNFIKNNKKVIVSTLALSLSVFVGSRALASIPKTVQVKLDQESSYVSTSADTVEGLLLEQGYSLEDLQVNTDLETQIRNNIEIEVNTKKNIWFNNQGKSLNVTTFTNTVEDFLAENGITADEDDIVSPNQKEKITDGQKVSYDQVDMETHLLTESIPFKEVIEYSFDLEYGQEELKTEGHNGTQTVDILKTKVNGNQVSEIRTSVEVVKEAQDQVTLIGSKEVVEETIANEVIQRKNDSMYKDQTKVIEAGSKGLKRYVYENKGEEGRELVSESIIEKPVNRIVEVGTKTRPASSTSRLYTLKQFRFHGVIRWSGYKFTYYSQSVLPGKGLKIPGRHVNADGFVADKDGYIVLASNYSIPKGTIINTPFGAKGKVYDRCASCTLNWYDVYTR